LAPLTVSYSYSVDSARRLAVVRMSDVLTGDELFAAVAQLRADADITSDFSTLIDLTEVTSVDAITGDVVRNLAASSVKAVNCCAFVATSPAVFGLARMFASYREARGNSERIGVFRTDRDAEEWLQLNGPTARVRPFEAGDHACGVYSSRAQLVRLASRFVA